MSQTPFALDEIIDVELFTSEIEAEISDLTEAMRTQTARAAYYGVLFAKAKKQADSVDLRIKALTAALTTKHRKALNDAAKDLADAEGTKPEKITVDMVQAAVALDPIMRKWDAIKLDADEIKTVCQVARDAFRTRQDMIVSLGHMTREQMRTNIQIQSAKEAATGYRERRARRQQEAAEQG